MRWFLASRSAWIGALALSVAACSDEHAGSKADAGDVSEDGGASTPEATGGDGQDGTGNDGEGSGDPSGGGDGGGSDGDASAADDGGEAPPCGGSCDDGVDCTQDSCVAGACQHTLDPSACADGASCSSTQGCQQGKACGTDADCSDDDGCTVNERCDPALARCVWQPLDRDGDRFAPESCGGADCNDADGDVAPIASDVCNGADDDCDGSVDEGTSCAGGALCEAGQCVCPEGTTRCGAECVDLATSAAHCGSCRVSCGAGTCSEGACSCGAPATQCGPSCVDTQTSEAHCGACGQACVSDVRNGQPRACLGGACTACGLDGQACCEGALDCLGGLTCSGGQCSCAGTQCGDTCADLQSDRMNCGACGAACQVDENCVASGGSAACAPCGGAGEACCKYLPDVPAVCLSRALTCGAGDVCVRITGP